MVKKIGDAGFKINVDKTRMHCRGSRQLVTGLVVNEKSNIRSEYYRRARAMCDSLFQTGQYYRTRTPQDDPDEQPVPDLTDSLNPLEGILSHIYMVTQSEATADRFKSSVWSHGQFGSYIDASYFINTLVAPQAPLVVTEGKTDLPARSDQASHAIFIRSSVARLRIRFEFAIRFFKYGGLSIREILGLTGGVGALRSIPIDYLHNIDSNQVG